MFDFTLPSGRQIVMKLLNFRERQEAVRIFKSGKEEGYLLDELLAAMALVSVDGKDFSSDLISDPITRMDEWELKDVQHFLELFMALNSLDDKGRKAAEEQAKKALGG